eukprot:GHVN01024290.1.p1 GENE.GHVN01024290.1~~GHVN01024290.1.p1  ORF type:complete len:900 (+),score=102.89 GHVN01024290.1:669-3368(+)
MQPQTKSTFGKAVERLTTPIPDTGEETSSSPEVHTAFAMRQFNHIHDRIRDAASRAQSTQRPFIPFDDYSWDRHPTIDEENVDQLLFLTPQQMDMSITDRDTLKRVRMACKDYTGDGGRQMGARGERLVARQRSGINNNVTFGDRPLVREISASNIEESVGLNSYKSDLWVEAVGVKSYRKTLNVNERLRSEIKPIADGSALGQVSRDPMVPGPETLARLYRKPDVQKLQNHLPRAAKVLRKNCASPWFWVRLLHPLWQSLWLERCSIFECAWPITDEEEKSRMNPVVYYSKRVPLFSEVSHYILIGLVNSKVTAILRLLNRVHAIFYFQTRINWCLSQLPRLNDLIRRDAAEEWDNLPTALSQEVKKFESLRAKVEAEEAKKKTPKRDKADGNNLQSPPPAHGRASAKEKEITAGAVEELFKYDVIATSLTSLIDSMRTLWPMLIETRAVFVDAYCRKLITAPLTLAILRFMGRRPTSPTSRKELQQRGRLAELVGDPSVITETRLRLIRPNRVTIASDRYNSDPTRIITDASTHLITVYLQFLSETLWASHSKRLMDFMNREKAGSRSTWHLLCESLDYNKCNVFVIREVCIFLTDLIYISALDGAPIPINEQALVVSDNLPPSGKGKKAQAKRYTLGDRLEEQLAKIIKGSQFDQPAKSLIEAGRSDPESAGSPQLGNPITWEDVNRRATAVNMALKAVSDKKKLSKETLFKFTSAFCGRSRASAWPSKVDGSSSLPPRVTTMTDKEGGGDPKKPRISKFPPGSKVPAESAPTLGLPWLNPILEDHKSSGGIQLNIACWNPLCKRGGDTTLLGVAACPRCKVSSYCSERCANEHWNNGHVDICSRMEWPPTFLRFHTFQQIHPQLPTYRYRPLDVFGEEETFQNYMATRPATAVIF